MFLAFGDWGENTPLKEAWCALIGKSNLEGVLLLGDNFYEYGVDGVDDPKFETEFAIPFPPHSYYTMLGNHDYLGDVECQLEYGKRNPHWIMPSRYYDHEFEHMHYIVLDTFELAPYESRLNSIAMGMSGEKAGRVFGSLNALRQLAWLERTLSTRRKPWVVVAGHYPMYSNGPHGNTTELLDVLLPILIKYQVNVYLAGHDHVACHTFKHGIHFVVSGMGSRQCQDVPAVAFLHPLKYACSIGFVNEDGSILSCEMMYK